MSERPTYKALEQRVRDLEQAESLRKRAEEKARRAVQEWNATFESASDAIWIMDADQRVRRANKMARTFFGDSKADFIGKHCWALIHGTNAPIPNCPAPRVKESLVGQMMEMQIGDRWFHISVDPILDANGRCSGLVHILRDITKRKLTEEALAESEKKFRSMMEAFVDPLYICSSDFVVDYMNPAMIRRIGRDATGEKCHQVLHGLDMKCNWCVFNRLSIHEPIEIDVKSPLDHRTYRVANMLIDNPDGTRSKMSVFRDITDYMQAIEDKEKAQAKLIQAQKMEAIGNLAGGIAHDFNNILTSIIGFTELALDDVEKDSVIEESLQEVYTAGKRAKDLVEQILAVARQANEPTQPIQIDKIIKEALKFIRSSMPSTIEIEQNLESKAFIMANPSQIHQIIMNLCTNAAYAMDAAGGVLRIGLKDVTIDHRSPLIQEGVAPGVYVEMTVADTGPGISPDILGLIFEPYFTTKTMGEGTGLGLSVVQGIVEKSGGKIIVESQVANGTTFRVFLPTTKVRLTESQKEKSALPKGTERILFVDDEAALAKLGAQILGSLGYRVTSLTDSVEALKLFKARPTDFDLVISDMTMPKMTGDVLATELMAVNPDIPIIMFTGYNKKISSLTVKEIGIKALAYKPIIKADLAKTVRTVLDGNVG